MALDDPKFRPAVKFTLKSIVVVLWTPIFLAVGFVVATAFPRNPILLHSKLVAERGARTENLRQIGGSVRLFADLRFDGDVAKAVDEYLRLFERARPDHSQPQRTIESNGIVLEFATGESIRLALNPSQAWLVREVVPESLSPALAVFADGHVASLER
jgi:hypothetical protein